MTRLRFPSLCTLLVLSGCALTQKPADVSDSAVSATPVLGKQPAAQSPSKPALPIAAPELESGQEQAAISLDRLALSAKQYAKNPTALKQFAGWFLQGEAKFIKTAKGNPNALAADVRLKGVGQASLWCRNVVGTPVINQMARFEGTLTGEVYTSENFSNDVYLKDCRFRD